MPRQTPLNSNRNFLTTDTIISLPLTANVYPVYAGQD